MLFHIFTSLFLLHLFQINIFDGCNMLYAKSLRVFVEANPGLHGVRLSMSPYREQEWMTNYPLYAVGVVL